MSLLNKLNESTLRLEICERSRPCLVNTTRQFEKTSENYSKSSQSVTLLAADKQSNYSQYGKIQPQSHLAISQRYQNCVLLHSVLFGCKITPEIYFSYKCANFIAVLFILGMHNDIKRTVQVYM